LTLHGPKALFLLQNGLMSELKLRPTKTGMSPFRQGLFALTITNPAKPAGPRPGQAGPSGAPRSGTHQIPRRTRRRVRSSCVRSPDSQTAMHRRGEWRPIQASCDVSMRTSRVREDCRLFTPRMRAPTAKRPGQLLAGYGLRRTRGSIPSFAAERKHASGKTRASSSVATISR